MLQLVPQPASAWAPRAPSRCWRARRACSARALDHQPRHRPARLPDAAAHRRGRDQGAARRPARLHAGPRHPAAARGGRGGHGAPPRRRGRAPTTSSSCPAARSPCSWRSLMFGEPGAEIMYPDPGFPIYRSLIEYTGADRCRSRCTRRTSFAFSAERGARADHAAHEADHPQQPGQPRPAAWCRRAELDAPRRRPRSAIRTSSSCRTRSMPAVLRRRAARTTLPAYPRSATG